MQTKVRRNGTGSRKRSILGTGSGAASDSGMTVVSVVVPDMKRSNPYLNTNEYTAKIRDNIKKEKLRIKMSSRQTALKEVAALQAAAIKQL